MKALIAGGGIAGTVAAIALRRVGIDAMVFEAFDRKSEGVGAFLTLAANGIDALRAIDVDAESLGGIETPRMAAFLGDGRQLIELPFGRSKRSGAVARTIKRAELYGALRDDAIRRGVRIAYGKRLVAAGSA